ATPLPRGGQRRRPTPTRDRPATATPYRAAPATATAARPPQPGAPPANGAEVSFGHSCVLLRLLRQALRLPQPRATAIPPPPPHPPGQATAEGRPALPPGALRGPRAGRKPTRPRPRRSRP